MDHRDDPVAQGYEESVTKMEYHKLTKTMPPHCPPESTLRLFRGRVLQDQRDSVS